MNYLAYLMEMRGRNIHMESKTITRPNEKKITSKVPNNKNYTSYFILHNRNGYVGSKKQDQQQEEDASPLDTPNVVDQNEELADPYYRTKLQILLNLLPIRNYSFSF